MTSYPPQYGHGGAAMHMAPRPEPKNGLGIAALVLGIIAVATGWIPIAGFAGFLCGLVGAGVGLGGLARISKERADNKAMTIVGLVLSILGVIVSLVMWIALVNASNKTVTPGVTDATPAANAPAVVPPAGPPTQLQPQSQTTFNIGDSVTINDTFDIKVEQLKPTRPEYGSTKLLCSMVTMENRGPRSENYNLFEWGLQRPDNVIDGPASAGPDALTYGDLATGQKVAGNVCFEETGVAGVHKVVYKPIGGGVAVEWVVNR